jgi:hypothetical protein
MSVYSSNGVGGKTFCLEKIATQGHPTRYTSVMPPTSGSRSILRMLLLLSASIDSHSGFYRLAHQAKVLALHADPWSKDLLQNSRPGGSGKRSISCEKQTLQFVISDGAV